MEFKQLVEEIVKNGQWYERVNDVEIDKHFAAYNLIKEIGQFADATLINQGRVRPSKRLNEDDAKDRLTQELVDIIALAIINANLHGIDIERGIVEKWVQRTGSKPLPDESRYTEKAAASDEPRP